MKKDDCVFCKIANGVFSSRKLYEDENFVVILDLNPASKGHALIIPKEHYADLYEMPEELCGQVMKLAKKMAAQMTEALGCDGFNIVQNNGEVSGQTVFHFHMHLIPRYKEDAPFLTWTPHEVPAEELDAVLATILK